jgi:peptidoglycan/LPS O-acetylase OafA/YrhL
VNEIKALTSLRGIAAMMVVMQHFSATAQRHAAANIPSLVPHGYMAVDLFFVLSGFIMAYTYSNDFALRGILAMPSFLLKRAARILPLNTAMVMVITVAGLVSWSLVGRNIFFESTYIPYDIICNLLLLQGFGFGLNLNGPSWSICTEVAAYLVFPALLACALSRRTLLAGATLGVSVLALVVTSLNHPRLGLDVSSVEGEVTLCFAQFVLGLFTFRLSRLPAFRARLQGDRPALLAAAWVGACLCLRLDLLAAIGFPAVVATLSCNKGKVAALMATSVPYFLGEISFSIYLIHDPCRPLALEVLQALHPAPLTMVPALGFALLASLLVIPLAWVAYMIVERPGRRLVRGMTKPLMRSITPSTAARLDISA